MSDARSIVHPPELQAGKAASKALIRAFGGQEAAEAHTGKSQSQLSAYGGRNTPFFMPIDVVAALEGSTHGLPGHPHVTRWLAREAGYGLVRLPDAKAPPTQWSGFIAQLGKEAGEVINGICTDLISENDVSPAEAATRLGDAADLVRIAIEIEAALKARAEGA